MTPPSASAPLPAAPRAAAAAAVPPVYRYPEIPDRPRFDMAALARLLEGGQGGMRARVKAILSRPAFRYYTGGDRAEQRELTLAWCRELAREGISATLFPRSVGGTDDIEGFMAAFETLALHDISMVIKFGVQFGLWGGSVLQLGTERHHQKYLPATLRLELPGCFAMTEIHHGSNVKDCETTATYDRATQEFVLHTPHPGAGKNYIGNAARHGRIASVFAQLVIDGTSQGVHAFVVPLRDAEGRTLPGVAIADNEGKMGLNGVDNGLLWFDQVRVPRSDLLDRFATVEADGTYRSAIENPTARFFTMVSTLVGGRVSIAAAGNSAAKSGLAIALRYAARRRQFGNPKTAEETLLLDYPAHQRRLLPLLASTYAVDFALKHLVRTHANRTGDQAREIESLAAALKAWATWNCTEVLQTGRECCGGEGYLAANRFAALKGDTDIFTTFEGDNTVLMQLVAKNLLSELRQKFKRGELSASAIFQKKMRNALRHKTPWAKDSTNAAELRHGAWQLEMLRVREQEMLIETGARIRNRTGHGLDAYDAFIRHQVGAIALAHAWVERVMLEQFQVVVEFCEDPKVQAVLAALSGLFALSLIEKHAAWYLERGFMGGDKSRAIRKEVAKLCAELRPDAVALVDAFGIPDELLSAPIALR